jgi:predicted DCC family thiol-disulfide oxidoreductase YuxK
MLESQINSLHKIVFFDGICHLCNGFVDFVIQNETAENPLVFAPLQGTTAQQYLSPEDRKTVSSVIFLLEGRIERKSKAVISILKCLRFPWPLVAMLLQLIPSPLRNLVYDWVAKNRYFWFGQRETCRLPLPDEMSKLLP